MNLQELQGGHRLRATNVLSRKCSINYDEDDVNLDEDALDQINFDVRLSMMQENNPGGCSDDERPDNLFEQ